MKSMADPIDIARGSATILSLRKSFNALNISGWGPEMTDRGEYRCVVKEYASGAPWLAFEPLRDIELPELKGKILGIDLRPGVSFEEAREIASILDAHMVGIAITR